MSDPRRAGGSSEVRSAQSIAALDARLTRLENTSHGSLLVTGAKAQTGGSLAVTGTTPIAVPGLSWAFPDQQVATLAIVVVTGNYTQVSGATAYGTLVVDGTARATEIMLTGASGGSAASGASSWYVSLAAGPHTFAVTTRSGSALLSTLTGAQATYFQTRA